MNTPLETLTLDAMRSLCEPLHKALSLGAEQADAAMKKHGLDSTHLDWLRHHYVRAVAHKTLRELRDDVRPWSVSPHKPNNGPLQLMHRGMSLRVLHGIDGGVPAPGKNRARRNFYVQPALDCVDEEAVLAGLNVSRFIAAWEISDRETHEVAIRIIRPTGTFKYGGTAKVDLAFWLPDEAIDLESLTWESSDQGIDLPIPGEEQSDVQPLRG